MIQQFDESAFLEELNSLRDEDLEKRWQLVTNVLQDNLRIYYDGAVSSSIPVQIAHLQLKQALIQKEITRRAK